MESKNKLASPQGCLARLVRLLAARLGYALIPISEIERMESEATDHYRVTRGRMATKSSRAYFNGLADYGSKTAHRLRTKYLPNESSAAAGSEGNAHE